MDVSVRELRNHTARVISAVEAGEPVTLTKHGRPLADIVPRRTRSERRPTEVLVRELCELQEMWERSDARGPASDYDTGLSTDDMIG